MKRNVAILAFCLAMMISANSLLVATAALVGIRLASDPAWATFPIGLMFVGTLCCTYPASMLMKHVGRRAGFSIGLLLGAIGAVLAALGILTGSFGGFCLGALLIAPDVRILELAAYLFESFTARIDVKGTPSGLQRALACP